MTAPPADRIAKRLSTAELRARVERSEPKTTARNAAPTQQTPPADRIAVRS